MDIINPASNNILSDERKFEIVKKKYGYDLNIWMKIQFSAVSTNNDIIINSILDKLNEYFKYNNTIDKSNLIVNNLKFDDFSQDEKTLFIEYIYEFYYKNYLNGDAPNPLWAD
jgi:hypothetical protein